MTTNSDVYRELGQHSAEIKAVNDKIASVNARLEHIEEVQAQILAKLNQVGGGWKAFVGMGMAVAGLISVLGHVFELVRDMLPHIKS